MKRTWLIPAMGVLASGLLMVPAQAAPVSGAIGDLKLAAGENAGVEEVHRRRYRHRHYRRYSHRGYRSWRRPGIQLHFGHRRHYRRW